MPRDDLRKGRGSLAYHVTASTEFRRPVFRDYTCARLLVAEKRRLQDAARGDSQARVIMSDHVHWLFQLGGRENLSAVVKELEARSTRAIGRANEFAPGPLWQRSFYAHVILGDEDLRAVARYIVANPLRAGLVVHLGDYSWWDAVWLAGEFIRRIFPTRWTKAFTGK